MNTLRGDHFDLETFERETEYGEMDFSPNMLAVIELSKQAVTGKSGDEKSVIQSKSEPVKGLRKSSDTCRNRKVKIVESHPAKPPNQHSALNNDHDICGSNKHISISTRFSETGSTSDRILDFDGLPKSRYDPAHA
jgi:hypothetical protein